MVRWSRWWRGASAPVPPAAPSVLSVPEAPAVLGVLGVPDGTGVPDLPAVVDLRRPWGGSLAALAPLAAFDELLVCLWVNDRFADVVQQRRADLTGQHLGQIDFTLMTDLLPRLEDVLRPGGPDAHLTLDEPLDDGCRHWEVACSALQLPDRPVGVGLSLSGGSAGGAGDANGPGGLRPSR